VAKETGAATVVATADFGPYGSRRDTDVGTALAALGGELRAVGSPYVVAPGLVRASSGAPFRVFTAYHRVWAQIGSPPPYPVPEVAFVGAESTTSTAAIEDGLAGPGRAGLPEWWSGLPLGLAPDLPPAGPEAAVRRLSEFVAGPLPGYDEGRNQPGRDATSRLSPYLHFGSLHPRTVLDRAGAGPGALRLRAELAWRDFYADVLWHDPSSAYRPLLPFAENLRWDTGVQAQERFRAWATGRTGYPLVDAGMRQLLAEGWMHNRARMVTASFLVKDLHIDWRLGARWFMWHLVDGDVASNQHGWQWVAGTGTDAAPFHRVFNPEAQRERFDADGSYVERYAPDALGDRLGGLFAPTPTDGRGAYPPPLVDHDRERRDALARFSEARAAARGEVQH
jgi:deoxyribodipyrimidine photo-lyase